MRLAGVTLVLGLCTAAACALGNEASDVAQQPATVLEPVFVEASTGDAWRYFEEGGYEVISHCPQGFNRAFALALDRAKAARLAVLPERFWGVLATPMKIVLYNRRPKKVEGLGFQNPIDLAWVADPEDIAGGRLEHSYPITVGDGDTYINCGNYWDIRVGTDDFSVDPDSRILLDKRVPALPRWFVTGMTGRFGLFTGHFIEAGWQSATLILPPGTWLSGKATAALRKAGSEGGRARFAAVRGDVLPLEDILGTRPSGISDELWDSEAALIVRWGTETAARKRAFLDYVDAAAHEPATEELFAKHMGMGYEEAERRMLDFLPSALADLERIPLGKDRQVELEPREALSDEVARIVGEWGRMEGRSLGFPQSSYKSECAEQSQRLFEQVYRRGIGDATFLAAFGLYAEQEGDSARASKALEFAANSGVRRPMVYVELAHILLEENLPGVSQGVGDLEKPEFDRIRSLLDTARVQMPSLIETYDVMTTLFEHAPTLPSLGDLRPLEDGLALYPRDAALAWRVAFLCRTLGYNAEAESIIARARLFADSRTDLDQLSLYAKKPKG